MRKAPTPVSETSSLRATSTAATTTRHPSAIVSQPPSQRLLGEGRLEVGLVHHAAANFPRHGRARERLGRLWNRLELAQTDVNHASRRNAKHFETPKRARKS